MNTWDIPLIINIILAIGWFPLAIFVGGRLMANLRATFAENTWQTVRCFDILLLLPGAYAYYQFLGTTLAEADSRADMLAMGVVIFLVIFSLIYFGAKAYPFFNTFALFFLCLLLYFFCAGSIIILFTNNPKTQIVSLAVFLWNLYQLCLLLHFPTNIGHVFSAWHSRRFAQS